jgi:hypothetical protein
MAARVNGTSARNEIECEEAVVVGEHLTGAVLGGEAFVPDPILHGQGDGNAGDRIAIQPVDPATERRAFGGSGQHGMNTSEARIAARVREAGNRQVVIARAGGETSDAAVQLKQANPATRLKPDRAGAVAVGELVETGDLRGVRRHRLAEEYGQYGSPIAVFADGAAEMNAIGHHRDVLPNGNHPGRLLRHRSAGGRDQCGDGAALNEQLIAVDGSEGERVAGVSGS